jgi:Family of unknown function (DUF5681)
MPTDDCRLPLRPVLPWQRPPVTRNRKGQWQRGVSGNPKGRPTKAKLAARLAARPATRDGYERMKRAAAYDGMTPQELTRVLRATYGKLGWQAQAARDMLMSKRGIFRWAKGVHKISHANERLLLTLCLRQARANYRYVLALYRRAVAAANAREELASLPRYRPLTRPGARPTVF